MRLNDCQDEGPAPVAPVPKHHPQTARVKREKKVHWTPTVISDDRKTETPTTEAKPVNISVARHSSRQPSIYSDGFMQENFFSRDFVPAWNRSIDDDFPLPGKWASSNSGTIPVEISSNRGSPMVTQTIPPTAHHAPMRMGPPRSPRPTQLPSPDLSDDLESEFCDCCDQGNHVRRRGPIIYQMPDNAGDKVKAQSMRVPRFEDIMTY